MFVLLRAGLLMSRSKAGSCGRSGACRFVKEKVAAIFNRGLYDMNITILMRDINRWALSSTFVALSQHGRKAGKV